MSNENEPKRRYILFGDGSTALIRGVPRETLNEDGVSEIVFNLEPRPSVIRKFGLRFPEDYDDQKNQTIKRSYYSIDCMPLGESPINKEYLRLAKMMEDLTYALKPMMGEGKFLEFKNALKKFSMTNRALIGCMKITDDPQTEFQYICFNDFNGNPTKASNILIALTETNKNLQKELFSAGAKVARSMELVKVARSEIQEHLKQTKSESDTLGEKRVYDTQPSQEDLAARDQNY